MNASQLISRPSNVIGLPTWSFMAWNASRGKRTSAWAVRPKAPPWTSCTSMTSFVPGSSPKTMSKA